MNLPETPIEMEFKSANPNTSNGSSSTVIRTFNSYNFNRSVLTPASSFRFTAPGVDKSQRNAIRSGDNTFLWITNAQGIKLPVATGIIDETDTHVRPNAVEYVLTGRDLLSQFVDNAAVDAQNAINNVATINLENLLQILLRNTRLPQGYIKSQLPNGSVLFNTNPGETKINTIDRYLEFTNCLIWCAPNGQVIIGKPNFTQKVSGSLILNSSDETQNNVVEARVQRNLNTAIRQIVTQLSTNGQVAAGKYTVLNAAFSENADTQARATSLVGRSVYRTYSYGSGTDVINQITQVGNSNADPQNIGNALSLREIAQENIKVLNIEIIVPSHVNEQGNIYNVDQMYTVQIEDEDVNEDMYVYDITYELTLDHGLITRMKLCRRGAIVAYAAAVSKGTS
jgi:prophage tail gpP-like protein